MTFPVRVGVETEIFHPDLPQKRLGPVEPRGVHIDRDHAEGLIAGNALKTVEAGHFLAAGPTPGGPEIQENRPALEGGDVGRSAVMLENEVLHRPGLGADGESRQIALGERREFPRPAPSRPGIAPVRTAASLLPGPFITYRTNHRLAATKAATRKTCGRISRRAMARICAGVA